MKFIVTLLFVFLTLPVHASSIVVLGDSLSAAYRMDTEQGWVHLMQQRLQSQGFPHRVINASVSGDTTQNGIARLQTLLQQEDADIVIIELGGNDGLRGTPPLAIKRNLQRLVDMAHSVDARVLLLGIRLPSNYGAAYTRQFERIYPAVAEDKAVSLVPFFMQDVALVPERMLDDGIHPSAAGQPYLLDRVWPYLSPLLK